MSGDGLGGLALAITLASLCILVLPALLLGGGSYFVARKTKWAGLAALGGGLLGAASGFLAVNATFYESRWDPPLSITFEVPPGFHHETVILLEDPAGIEIPWSGLDVPFASPTATLPVPSSGVVRVRSVAALYEHDRRGHLSTGEMEYGLAMMPAPPGLGATQLVIFDFAPFPGRETDLTLLDPEPLAEAIRAREAER